MTPVPPLSVTSLNPPLSPLERDTWTALRTLLSGPYAINTTRLLKQLLQPTALGGSGTVGVVSISSLRAVRCAEGAARAVRFALRRAAEGRLARGWLSRVEASRNYFPAGSSVGSGSTSFGAAGNGNGNSGGVGLGMSFGGANGSVSGSIGGFGSGFGYGNGNWNGSGATMPLITPDKEKEMIDCAWGQVGEASWDLGRVAGIFGKAMEKWLERICRRRHVRSEVDNTGATIRHPVKQTRKENRKKKIDNQHNSQFAIHKKRPRTKNTVRT